MNFKTTDFIILYNAKYKQTYTQNKISHEV